MCVDPEQELKRLLCAEWSDEIWRNVFNETLKDTEEEIHDEKEST